MKKSLFIITLLLSLSTFAFSAPQDNLSIHFLDVGQSDCEVILDSTGKCIVIDAGSPDTSKQIIGFLKSKKVSNIDLLILTHPHADHIGSSSALLKAFKVDSIFMPQVTSNSKMFQTLVRTIKSQNKKVHAPVPGEKLSIGNMNLEFYGPVRTDKKNVNNNSIVFRLSFGKTKVLFMGDAERFEEKDILDGGRDIKADVLKVAHHGSNSSSTDALLKKVNPEYAIIEVGKKNDFGHPSPKTINRLIKTHGIKVYQTALDGTIEMRTDGASFQFIREKGNP